MKVFIDANKYLDLLRVYRDASRSDIIKFLIEKQKKNSFEIVVTDQVLDEFYRNEYLLRGIQIVIPELNLQIPSFMQKIPEVKQITKIKRRVERLSKVIQEKYIERLTNRNSSINKKIEGIISKAVNISASQEILIKAHMRFLRGNPPGKMRNCIGDAISWETLLAFCADDNLVIVSRDSDFFDKASKRIEEDKINTFLKREWENKFPGKTIKVCHSFISLMALFPDKNITKKEIKNIKKDEVGLTKGLSYSVQVPVYPTGPTGPAGPINLLNLSGYSSSVFSTNTDSPFSTINNDAYLDPINGISLAPETYKIPDHISSARLPASALMREDIKCSLCGRKLGTLPLSSYLSSADIFCSDCSTNI